MKAAFFLLLSVAFAMSSTAQEHWTVQLNSKTLLTAKTEDTAANVATINDIKKGSLLVTYAPGKVQSGWSRKIMVFDNADNELYTKEALSIVIPAATLKKWQRAGLSQLKIFTMAVPKDPAVAMRVRLRRVHLCTINLED